MNTNFIYVRIYLVPVLMCVVMMMYFYVCALTSCSRSSSSHHVQYCVSIRLFLVECKKVPAADLRQPAAAS